MFVCRLADIDIVGLTPSRTRDPKAPKCAGGRNARAVHYQLSPLAVHGPHCPVGSRFEDLAFESVNFNANSKLIALHQRFTPSVARVHGRAHGLVHKVESGPV